LRLVEVKAARWAQLIFSWYGIPFMMTQDFSRDGIYALAGKAVDNICMNAQNVLALERRAADGSDLVLLQNLNYDPEREVLLRRRVRPSSVEVMDDHGAWRAAAFTWADGLVTIPGDWPCYGVKFLRVR
jgi:hypothetical protein